MSSQSFLDYVDEEVKHETFLKAKKFVNNCNTVKNFLLGEGLKRKKKESGKSITNSEKTKVSYSGAIEYDRSDELWIGEVTTMGSSEGKVDVSINLNS